jgi:hypothetical protein
MRNGGTAWWWVRGTRRPTLRPVIPRLLCRADGMVLSSTPPRCELSATRSFEVVGQVAVWWQLVAFVLGLWRCCSPVLYGVSRVSGRGVPTVAVSTVGSHLPFAAVLRLPLLSVT